jgi:hypothetical protein
MVLAWKHHQLAVHLLALLLAEKQQRSSQDKA